MNPTRRTSSLFALSALAGLLAPVALVAGSAGSATAAPAARPASGPSVVDLPAGFAPEGIAAGQRDRLYVGSRVDGDLFRFNARTGKGKVFSQGPGTPSLGLKVDGENRLWVAGGSGGDARVVDARSGDVLASYQLVPKGTPAFVNDVVLTPKAAWFTDSLGANLYKVPLAKGPKGKLPILADVSARPLTGQWTQTPGVNNANGITTTPDGKALLVVNSSNGQLYRVARNGEASVVNLRGAVLTNGDGLLREGRTLYAVQNRLNQVAVLRLTKSGRSATLQRTLTSPAFDVPSTIARRPGGDLYLPNARFTTPQTPTTPYAVTRVSD